MGHTHKYIGLYLHNELIYQICFDIFFNLEPFHQVWDLYSLWLLMLRQFYGRKKKLANSTNIIGFEQVLCLDA